MYSFISHFGGKAERNDLPMAPPPPVVPAPFQPKAKAKAKVIAKAKAVAKAKAKAKAAPPAKAKPAGGTAFMRSTKKVGANVPWNAWARLRTRLPANFNEAKYLANNPDVANAVRAKVMPSGAWHYVMYGMGPDCQAGLNPSGAGTCDPNARSFSGWRRPGYLAGIFANWDQND